MTLSRTVNRGLATLFCLSLAGCGALTGGNGSKSGALSSSGPEAEADRGTTIWDIFKPSDAGTNVKVNKYIWTAALDVLNFLPVESVDPFTGVIVTGYGRPPGGGRAYRATILVKDAALEARSLNLALLTRNGPAAPGTVRAVEDAILARARQFRIADGKL